MVTQMFRQSDAEVFKLYSQAKLGMMREALAKLDRQANERPGNWFTERQLDGFHSQFCHNRAEIGARTGRRKHCNKRVFGRAAEI